MTIKSPPISVKIYADSPLEAMWTYYRGLETVDAARSALGEDISPATVMAARDTIRQAREYFSAARASPLLTRPVLTYYGMVSLAKLLFLFDQTHPRDMAAIEAYERKGHGLKQHDPVDEGSDFHLETATIEITADGKPGALTPRGVFPHLARVVAGPAADAWLGTHIPVLTLFRCIPQLEAPLALVFGPEADYLGLAVETLNHADDSIQFSVDLAPSGTLTIEQINARVPYLQALGSPFVAASYTRNGRQTATVDFPSRQDGFAVAIREEYFRETATFPPHCHNVKFDSILASYAVMYALSIVARYKPHRWAAILDGEGSSLLPLIETFVATSERWWPNLLLNRLTRNWIRFAHPSYW